MKKKQSSPKSIQDFVRAIQKKGGWEHTSRSAEIRTWLGEQLPAIADAIEEVDFHQQAYYVRLSSPTLRFVAMQQWSNVQQAFRARFASDSKVKLILR